MNSLCKKVIAAATACLAVSILVTACRLLRQPSYNGRPVSYWFKQLPAIYGDPSAGKPMIYPERGAGHEAIVYSMKYYATPAVPATGITDYPGALAAVRAIGTNGLPFLVRKLQGRPPPRLIRLMQRYAGTWPIIGTILPPQDLAKEQGQAVAGLLALCPLPPDAVQKLRNMSVEFSGSCWYQDRRAHV